MSEPRACVVCGKAVLLDGPATCSRACWRKIKPPFVKQTPEQRAEKQRAYHAKWRKTENGRAWRERDKIRSRSKYLKEKELRARKESA